MTAREEAVGLLRRLIACDTSNPPGRETQAVAVIEDHIRGSGLGHERVAKDPDRANLVLRLRGSGDGPTLAFLCHLDTVIADRTQWQVDPFAGIERDGFVWGRGAVDMKCAVAAWTTALARLARAGHRPPGDVLLLAVADEEVGESGAGAPYLVEARPDLCPDFVIGEGAGERFPTSAGPIYSLDRGIKCSASATVTVLGTPGDASLPGGGESALVEAARLLERIAIHESPPRVPPEMEALVAAADGSPALQRVVAAGTANVFHASNIVSDGPQNVVADEATINVLCATVPEASHAEIERELRAALGEGRYELEITPPKGGSTSELGTPLHAAIDTTIAELDPEARVVPMLGYGFSDCHVMREAYGSVAYGFIPFRHGDPMTNLETKHGVDERVRVEDVEFQVEVAMGIVRNL